MVKSDDRGVSPVIGVILMVAITVILAAVIGAFVLNMGQDASNPAPSASFEFSYDSSDGKLTVTMAGGQKIDANTVRLSVNGSTDNTTFDLPVQAGDSANKAINVSSGETVRVIWESDSGDTQVLARYTIP